jgi:hypothetical protein
VKTRFPVPPVALVVPPVTVSVSAAARPRVVESVELDIDALGGELILIVKMRVEDFDWLSVTVSVS